MTTNLIKHNSRLRELTISFHSGTCFTACFCSVFLSFRQYYRHPQKVTIYLTLKSTVIWVVTPCSSEGTRRFGRTSPPRSGSKSKQSKKPAEADGKLSQLSFPPASAGFLFGLLFDPEGGGDMSFRSFPLSPNQHLPQPSRCFEDLIPLYFT
jgi:hypothetical protein